MGFLSTFVVQVIEFVLLIGVAVGGIRLGKYLRDRKDIKSNKQEDLS